jgi:hypothetical protein
MRTHIVVGGHIYIVVYRYARSHGEVYTEACTRDMRRRDVDTQAASLTMHTRHVYTQACTRDMFTRRHRHVYTDVTHASIDMFTAQALGHDLMPSSCLDVSLASHRHSEVALQRQRALPSRGSALGCLREALP